MRKKGWTFFLCLFVAALFIGVAFAFTKQISQWIEAEDGGVIRIFGNAVKLVILPDALKMEYPFTCMQL